jgi:hypothetical protein
VQKAAALAAPLACLNTMYFWTETRYVGAFRGVPFGMVDEADVLEGPLLHHSAVSVIEYRWRTWQLPLLVAGPITDEVVAWLEMAREATVADLAKLDGQDQNDPRVQRQMRSLEQLAAGLQDLCDQGATARWVVAPAASRRR